MPNPFALNAPTVTLEFTTVMSEPLYDGLTRWDCLERWKENRAAIEAQKPLPNVLSPLQIAIARTTWQVTAGLRHALALRAKVDKTETEDAARRPSVRVEVDE